MVDLPNDYYYFQDLFWPDAKSESTIRPIYSGCQKSVAVFKRFFSTTVQPFMPQFRNSEPYYEKRYVVVVKKCCGTETFFSTTTYAAIPQFGTLL